MTRFCKSSCGTAPGCSTSFDGPMWSCCSARRTGPCRFSDRWSTSFSCDSKPAPEPATSRLSRAARPTRSLPGGRRDPPCDTTSPGRATALAHDSGARLVHRHRHRRRRRQREDQRLHVSLRRAAPGLPGGRPDAAHGRLGPRGQRATSATRSARCLNAHGRERRLRRGQSGVALPLQPAPQRPGSVRAGVRHRLAPQQPLRPERGAVLAAGLHEPREVHHPAAQGRR